MIDDVWVFVVIVVWKLNLRKSKCRVLCRVSSNSGRRNRSRARIFLVFCI